MANAIRNGDIKMKNRETTAKPNKEITAISAVYDALSALDASAQRRVIVYVEGMLGLTKTHEDSGQVKDDPDDNPVVSASDKVVKTAVEPNGNGSSDEFDGISPVAQKWMRRNGIQSRDLAAIFSLGSDEIDLVAKSVPGKSATARMRSVFLLKGIAAYLGGGAARFTHEQVKETCLHYKAYDRPNFAARIKKFFSDVTGSKESGYTLTARGLADAAELLKGMIAANATA